MEKLAVGNKETVLPAGESVSRALSGGRLVEYITGLKLDDPKLVERMSEDQKSTREKYGLPAKELRLGQPAEYERLIRGIAEKIGTRISQWSECGQLIEDTQGQGVYFGDNRIAVDVDRSTSEKYEDSLEVLTHEVIHALQEEYSPRMPIELMEYEAYIADANVTHFAEIEDSAERIKRLDRYFRSTVGASVRSWYAHKSKIDGKETKPEWDDKKYFEKRDAEAREGVA